eukprot:Rmarinus@m.5046
MGGDSNKVKYFIRLKPEVVSGVTTSEPVSVSLLLDDCTVYTRFATGDTNGNAYFDDCLRAVVTIPRDEKSGKLQPYECQVGLRKPGLGARETIAHGTIRLSDLPLDRGVYKQHKIRFIDPTGKTFVLRTLLVVLGVKDGLRAKEKADGKIESPEVKKRVHVAALETFYDKIIGVLERRVHRLDTELHRCEDHLNKNNELLQQAEEELLTARESEGPRLQSVVGDLERRYFVTSAKLALENVRFDSDVNLDEMYAEAQRDRVPYDLFESWIEDWLKKRCGFTPRVHNEYDIDSRDGRQASEGSRDKDRVSSGRPFSRWGTVRAVMHATPNSAARRRGDVAAERSRGNEGIAPSDHVAEEICTSPSNRSRHQSPAQERLAAAISGTVAARRWRRKAAHVPSTGDMHLSPTHDSNHAHYSHYSNNRFDEMNDPVRQNGSAHSLPSPLSPNSCVGAGLGTPLSPGRPGTGRGVHPPTTDSVPLARFEARPRHPHDDNRRYHSGQPLPSTSPHIGGEPPDSQALTGQGREEGEWADRVVAPRRVWGNPRPREANDGQYAVPQPQRTESPERQRTYMGSLEERSAAAGSRDGGYGGSGYDGSSAYDRRSAAVGRPIPAKGNLSQQDGGYRKESRAEIWRARASKDRVGTTSSLGNGVSVSLSSLGDDDPDNPINRLSRQRLRELYSEESE